MMTTEIHILFFCFEIRHKGKSKEAELHRANPKPEPENAS